MCPNQGKSSQCSVGTDDLRRFYVHPYTGPPVPPPCPLWARPVLVGPQQRTEHLGDLILAGYTFKFIFRLTAEALRKLNFEAIFIHQSQS